MVREGGGELSDAQWALIQPLLPLGKTTGRPRADDRKTLEGILYVLRVGCRWKDLPRYYGAYSTCWTRLRRWEKSGVWERVWRHILSTLDQKGKLTWSQAFLDGSFVPAKRGERALV